MTVTGGHLGASGNSDSQFASKMVLNDFTGDALIISAGSLFKNGTSRMLKVHW